MIVQSCKKRKCISVGKCMSIVIVGSVGGEENRNVRIPIGITVFSVLLGQETKTTNAPFYAESDPSVQSCIARMRQRRRQPASNSMSTPFESSTRGTLAVDARRNGAWRGKVTRFGPSRLLPRSIHVPFSFNGTRPTHFRLIRSIGCFGTMFS